MKFDVVTDFESKSLAVICCLRDVADTEIASEVGGRCRIGGIDPDQNAIVLRKRMYSPESCFPVSVGTRRIAGDYILENAAAFLRHGAAGRNTDSHASCNGERHKSINSFHCSFLPCSLGC